MDESKIIADGRRGGGQSMTEFLCPRHFSFCCVEPDAFYSIGLRQLPDCTSDSSFSAEVKSLGH